MDERRCYRRRRSLLGSRIVFPGHNSLIDCITRNFSEGGALVEVATATLLPIRFDFELRQGATLVPARIAWRNGERTGIAFLG